MTFAQAIREESSKTKTLNGMDARSTTGSALLDLFGVVGSMRGRQDEVKQKFLRAYCEDAELATKMAFYTRDVRGGLGERDTARTIFKWLAYNRPATMRRNIEFVPYFGRWDDMYVFIGTPLEDDMWAVIRKQYAEDCENYKNDENISVMAKWLKSVNTSSKESCRLGRLTAQHLGLTNIAYQRILSTLRRHIDVVEIKMSRNQWESINYESVPSNAMTNYRKAFRQHDGYRFNKYLNQVTSGTKKINANTTYPYELVGKYIGNNMTRIWNKYYCSLRGTVDPVVEAQWKALPNYVDGQSNVLVVADTSGSMIGRPICSALGLAIYFAERNHGPFHNMFINFSNHPKLCEIVGDNLYEKLSSIINEEWYQSTNIKAVFDMILRVAKSNNLSSDDMPKSIVIVSDMEFNRVASGSFYAKVNWDFYSIVKEDYARAGYSIPNIVFWNVNSYQDTYHVKSDYDGVQLYSGSSVSTFKSVLEGIGYNPYDAMIKTLNSSRYQMIHADTYRLHPIRQCYNNPKILAQPY